MPSVNSRSMPNVWPSSTFTTPSLPTFSMASAITSPISSSPAEIVATRAIWSLPEISLDCSPMRSTTEFTASSMPRLRPSGFAPAATFFRPLRTIAWASTVAVVVPSPATSLVAVATSRTSCAPWFSKTSSTSISRAIVTPSLVMVGAPNFTNDGVTDRKSTRLNSSHTEIYTLSLHDALPILRALVLEDVLDLDLTCDRDAVVGDGRGAELHQRRRHRSEEHTSELQSHRDLHSFPTRRSSDLARPGSRRRPRPRSHVRS